MQVLKNIKITILYEAQLHSTSNQSAKVKSMRSPNSFSHAAADHVRGVAQKDGAFGVFAHLRVQQRFVELFPREGVVAG